MQRVYTDILNIHSTAKAIPKGRIWKVGLELEGQWDKRPSVEPLGNVQPDGSVRFESSLNAFHTGEISSPPLEIIEVVSYVRGAYPSRVNSTCGLHVHMSFRSRYAYQILMDPLYQDVMFSAIAKWVREEGLPEDHHVWTRLSGNHRHCQRRFLADAQVRVERKRYGYTESEDSRYTAINYPWLQHGTVECRLLPMMETADEAIRGIMVVLNTTNLFLSCWREREIRHESKLTFMAIPDHEDTYVIGVH